MLCVGAENYLLQILKYFIFAHTDSFTANWNNARLIDIRTCLRNTIKTNSWMVYGWEQQQNINENLFLNQKRTEYRKRIYYLWVN